MTSRRISRRTARLGRIGKVFNTKKLTEKETQVSALFLEVAKVCEGKPIIVVAEALDKLQDLLF